MKLRIHDNSIRLRLLRSEVTTFLNISHIEQTVYFGPGDHACMTYGLLCEDDLETVAVRYRPSKIIVAIPRQQAVSWAVTDHIGIYSTVDLGQKGSLAIIVEKDFACLDLSDVANQDTFPNPQVGTVC